MHNIERLQNEKINYVKQLSMLGDTVSAFIVADEWRRRRHRHSDFAASNTNIQLEHFR